MCKFNPKNDSRRIDLCIRELVKNLKLALNGDYKLLASCCGHGKYPMTLIVGIGESMRWDLVSGKYIPRKKKFYKKDKQGYYYIPEFEEDKFEQEEMCQEHVGARHISIPSHC